MSADSFQDFWQTWRKILAAQATAPDAEFQKVFGNFLHEGVTYCIPHGLARTDFVDAAQEIAEAYGYVERFGLDTLQNALSIEFRAFEEREVVPPLVEPNGHGAGEPAQPVIALATPFPIIEAQIPRRPWIVPGLAARRQVMVLVAPPGSGKSLLTVQFAMMMSSGIAWAGWRPRVAARVLMINSEDDPDELRRRMVAASNHMTVDAEKLHTNLKFADRPESIVIARYESRSRSVVTMPMVEAMIGTIIAGGFDVVIVDPFAETFVGDENSNNELKQVAILWREIARRSNAAVMLVHHTRKGANEAGDADVARGGGSLIGVCRMAATLFTMKKEEAKDFGIDVEQRQYYLRFDDAKANLNIITGMARWFRKETYTIQNAGDDEPGDNVGVLVPWQAQGLAQSIPDDVIDAIFVEINKGMTTDRGDSDPYTLQKRGAERWVGHVVMAKHECTPEQCKTILAAWQKAGWLQEFKQPISTSKGKERDCVRALGRMARLPDDEPEDEPERDDDRFI